MVDTLKHSRSVRTDMYKGADTNRGLIADISRLTDGLSLIFNYHFLFHNRLIQSCH